MDAHTLDTHRPQATSRPTRALPLWLLALGLSAFATGTDDMVIAGLLPRLSADLGVTEAAAGQLVTGYALVYGLGAPVLAVLTAHLPRRRVLVTSTVLFATANVLMAVAPGYASLLALRLVSAGLAALIVPTALAFVADLAPEERRGRWLSVITAGITLSLIAGVPLGTWVAGLVHWRATMLLVAVLSALAAVGMSRLPAQRRPRDGEQAPSLRQRVAPLTSPTVLTVSLAMVVAGSGGMMGYIYLAPLTLHLTGGLDRLALLILVFGVAGFGGVVLGGRGADRLGPGRTLGIGFTTAVAMTGVLALLAHRDEPTAFGPLAVVTAVWAGGLWSFSPPMQAWLLPRAGGMESAVLALSTSGMYLGFALAGAIGGLVLTRWGAATIPLVATVLLASGGVLLAVSMVRAHGERRSDDADR